MVDFTELPAWTKVLDAAMGVLFVLLVFVVWPHIVWRNAESAKSEDEQERAQGLASMTSQLTLSMTAASILTAAGLIVFQAGRDTDNPLSEGALAQVAIATFWFIFSILTGVYVSAIIPPRLRHFNVAADVRVNVGAFAQLLSIVGGVLSLALIFLIE